MVVITEVIPYTVQPGAECEGRTERVLPWRVHSIPQEREPMEALVAGVGFVRPDYGNIVKTADSDERQREAEHFNTSKTLHRLGLEDDVYWREGSLKAILANHCICTMISPVSMRKRVQKENNREVRETTPLTIRIPFCQPIHPEPLVHL